MSEKTDVVACQECHGQGEVYKEVSPGKWSYVKCPARCRGGRVSKRLI